MTFLSVLRLTLYCILVSCRQAVSGKTTVADDTIHTVGFFRSPPRPHGSENTLYGEPLPL